MAKRKKSKQRQSSTADYYKLKTQAVDDLVNADEHNSPPVSDAELKAYGARKKGGIPNWLKVGFIKFWFPGAVYFFIIMGLGLWDPLDQIVILGIVQGMVTDLLTNNMVRFIAETDGENDRFLMFSKKRYMSFFFNMLYSMLLCALVLFAYAGLDVIVRSLSGNPEFKFVGEPVTFGLLYMLFDTALVSVKNILSRFLFGAKNKNV